MGDYEVIFLIWFFVALLYGIFGRFLNDDCDDSVVDTLILGALWPIRFVVTVIKRIYGGVLWKD